MPRLMLHGIKSQETMNFSTAEVDLLRGDIVFLAEPQVVIFTEATLVANLFDSNTDYRIDPFLESISNSEEYLVLIHNYFLRRSQGLQEDLTGAKGLCIYPLSMF